MLKNDTQYLPALTGVRAIAAYMVFVHHFIPMHDAYPGFNFGYFFGEFHVGVTFFFVLSGFLIHHRYGLFGQVTLRSFWRYFANRIARIMPVFVILTTATLVFNYFFHKNDQGLLEKNLGLWLLNITLLKGFFSSLKFSGIPQSWSLTVEFCFYAAAPFLFSRVKNIMIYPRISAILLAIGFGMVYLFSQLPVHGFFGDNRFMLSYSFLGRSFEFFAGCYLSVNFKKWSEEKWSTGFFTYTSLAFILLLIYALSMVRQPQIYGVHTFPGLIINNFFLPLMIILFFRGLLFENTILSDLFSSKLFQVLGKSSYAFYLIHVGFIETGLSHFVSHNTVILFILLNMVSIGIYFLLEEPLNKWTKKRLVKQTVQKMAA